MAVAKFEGHSTNGDGKSDGEMAELSQQKIVYQFAWLKAFKAKDTVSEILALNNLISAEICLLKRSKHADMKSDLYRFYKKLLQSLRRAKLSGLLSDQTRQESLHCCDQAFNVLSRDERVGFLKDSGYTLYECPHKLEYYNSPDSGVGVRLSREGKVIRKNKIITFYFGVSVSVESGKYSFGKVSGRYFSTLSNPYVSPEIEGEFIVGGPIVPSLDYAGALINDKSMNIAAVKKTYSYLCETKDISSIEGFYDSYKKVSTKENNATFCGVVDSSKLAVISTKTISPGNELGVSYGPGYWVTKCIYDLRCKGEISSSEKMFAALKEIIGQPYEPNTDFGDLSSKDGSKMTLAKIFNFDETQLDGIKTSMECKEEFEKNVDVSDIIGFLKQCEFEKVKHLFFNSGIAFVSSFACYEYSINTDRKEMRKGIADLSSEYSYISGLFKVADETFDCVSGNSLKMCDVILRVCLYIVILKELPKQKQFPSPLFLKLANDLLFKFNGTVMDESGETYCIQGTDPMKSLITPPSYFR